jgi:hypothetical protein
MPDNFAPTFIFTSKYFETHLSMHTDSPLFKSVSVYAGLMHLEWHDETMLQREEKEKRVYI